jgi:xanthine dehydrogenase YagR molybdenum-binding subunit
LNLLNQIISNMGFFDEPNQVTQTPPADRVDGKLKVTGAAKFAAEYALPKLVHGLLVGSTIAAGRISKMRIKEAKKAPGVLTVMTHENADSLPGLKDEKIAKEKELGLRIFHTDEIFSNGQPIALVVADTLEQAQYAASLIKVKYEENAAVTDFAGNRDKAIVPANNWSPDLKRGDVAAWKNAAVKVEAEYTIPLESHNPIEMHATIAHWEADDKLVIHDKNHAIKDVQKALSDLLALPQNNITINAEFVGGGFGSGLRVWPHCIAAIMAAKKLKRPVKVCLTRPQMFTMTGYRPRSWQKISVGASANGQIMGLHHEAMSNTSTYESFAENPTGITKMMYQLPNLQTTYKSLALNLNTPIWMRAPGEATGSFALESALDTLAHELKMDPLELRLKNYADKNPDDQKPWSSNYLKDCYTQGAQAFGWAQRNPQVRATRMGDWWMGMGMGAGAWGAWRLKATARGVLDVNGRLLLQSAASDMGPGTATAMTNIATEVLGLRTSDIRFELGKSNLPDAPAQGGSFTTASVGSAVYDVCDEIKKQLLQLAVTLDSSPLKGNEVKDLSINAGAIARQSGSAITITQLMRLHQQPIEVTKTSEQGDEKDKYSFNSFAVHFAEVKVHAYTGVVRVSRFVTVADAGKIINTKTAANQIKGAVVGAIGMALMEQQEWDLRNGRRMANDFAGYHIPVNADVPEIDVRFINQPDPYLNKMGSKGLGEVGLIGSAAAIANAVFHATGKRITHLPITPDKMV